MISVGVNCWNKTLQFNRWQSEHLQSFAEIRVILTSISEQVFLKLLFIKSPPFKKKKTPIIPRKTCQYVVKWIQPMFNVAQNFSSLFLVSWIVNSNINFQKKHWSVWTWRGWLSFHLKIIEVACKFLNFPPFFNFKLITGAATEWGKCEITQSLSLTLHWEIWFLLI